MMTYEEIKQAAYEGTMKALAEARSKKKGNPDSISKNEAYRLKGRTRVDSLLSLGLLKAIQSGNAYRISKEQLESLDNVII